MRIVSYPGVSVTRGVSWRDAHAMPSSNVVPARMEMLRVMSTAEGPEASANTDTALPPI